MNQRTMKWLTLMVVLILALPCVQRPTAAQFDPFGGGAPDAPLVPGAAVTPSVIEVDPVIGALRESNPTTRPELMRAMIAMMNHGRPEEARTYLTKLLESGPGEEDLAALYRQFGAAFFVRLLQYQPLAPEGGQLARSIVGAANRAARDPARLAAYIQGLADPSISVRTAALRGLEDAQDSAFGPLVEALAESDRDVERAAIRDALAALGEPAIEPMIGALNAPQESIVIQAMNVLGRLRARRATLYLLRPYLSDGSTPEIRRASGEALLQIAGAVPSQAEAVALLYRRAQEYYGGVLPRGMDHQGLVELWTWDSQKNTVVARRYAGQSASLFVASRLAADLVDISPTNSLFRRLYLATTIESAKLAVGLDSPLPDDLVSSIGEFATPQAIEELLDHAIKHRHPLAAMGAAELLGQLGSQQLLHSHGGSAATLVNALRHSNRRVRFAAAQAILRLDPDWSFAGNSHLVDVLAFFVRSAGERRVMIGHPRIEQAQSLVGMMSSAGIVAETRATGREFFHLATAHSDYDFLLLSDALDHPHWKETLQEIRRDPRTAALPVGLIARQENFGEVKLLAELDPLTEAFPWPYDESGLSFQIQRLMDLAGHDWVSPQEKVEQAIVCLDGLLRFASDPVRYKCFDAKRHEDTYIEALNFPPLALPAARLLGSIGSPKAQRSLVDFASQNARPLANRTAAATQFGVAVGRRGTLLTTHEILQQYERYNQSELLDQGTQLVLSEILDTIESRRNRARN